MSGFLLAAAAAVLATVALGLLRILRGPGDAERMMAAQLLGTDPPPLTNTPNRSGVDPHGNPRIAPAEMQMVSDFLRPDADSHITNTCNGPCFAGGFTGP